MSLKAAAAAFNISPATAHRWWHRWLDGGREPGALLDRSSRPHRSPRLLASELAERICDCRRRTGWGPRLVAGATGFAHSTVWKVLRRAGNSYEWPCPGDLLHMDVSRYARFDALPSTTTVLIPRVGGPGATGTARGDPVVSRVGAGSETALASTTTGDNAARHFE